MTGPTNLFEMRRLEQLSNTVFGVAMTLLAYDLPRGARLENAPSWGALLDAYERQMIALALSFMIAGIFWMSHHRRLARAPYASRRIVVLNLVFLMSIVALPATNALYGIHRLSPVVAVVYFGHITLIAALNALLWYIAVDRDVRSPQVLASLLTVGLGVTAVSVAAVNPEYAPYPMLIAFASPLIGRQQDKGPALAPPQAED